MRGLMMAFAKRDEIFEHVFSSRADGDDVVIIEPARFLTAIARRIDMRAPVAVAQIELVNK